MDKLREFINQYRWTVLCVVAGLVFTLLLFTIGFFRTLLLLAVVAVCFLLGLTLDRSGVDGLKALVQKVFHRGDQA